MTTSDITATIEQWRGRLLDTSKRNRLISFHAGCSGGVGLAHPGADRIWETLVAGEGSMSFARRHSLLGEPGRSVIDGDGDGDDDEPEPTTADPGEGVARHDRGDELARCLKSPRPADDHLLTDLADKALAARLNRLARDARTSLLELGVTTLHLAFGLLRWYESPDSTVELRALDAPAGPARLRERRRSGWKSRRSPTTTRLPDGSWTSRVRLWLSSPSRSTPGRAEVLEELSSPYAITGVHSINAARMIIIGVGTSPT